MTMFKKGTHDSSIVVSSSVYACTSCDYTEIISGDKDDNKKCPKCDAEMQIVSASAESSIEDSDNE